MHTRSAFAVLVDFVEHEVVRHGLFKISILAREHKIEACPLGLAVDDDPLDLFIGRLEVVKQRLVFLLCASRSVNRLIICKKRVCEGEPKGSPSRMLSLVFIDNCRASGLWSRRNRDEPKTSFYGQVAGFLSSQPVGICSLHVKGNDA